MVRWLSEFFRDRLWRPDLRRMPLLPRLGCAVLRVAAHTVVHWSRDVVGIRASGLALVTLLSLVPLVALAFGVAQGFGFADTLDQAIVEQTADWPAHMQEAVQRVRELVDRTSFKALGWLSTLVLAYSGLVLFTRIEQALNLAWRTTHRRPWLRRASDFVSLVVVVPVLSLVALVSSSALHGAAWIVELRASYPWLGQLYDAGLGGVPHALLWVAFTALYKLMPSARVSWRGAFAGGVVAGSSLLFMHGFYLHFQVGVARMNAIYATLAALPLLLVYLQLGWTIVLLGADIGYAVQNLDRLGPGRSFADLPFALRERLAFKLTESACGRFASGAGPLPLGDLAAELDVPAEWLDGIASGLARDGILAQVRGGLVSPARPCAQITVDVVRRSLRGTCPRDLDRRLSLSPTLERELASIEEAERRQVARVGFAVTGPG